MQSRDNHDFEGITVPEHPQLLNEAIMRVVTFRVGSRFYGIDVFDLRAAAMPQEVRVIPNTPAYIDGVIDIRGTMVPVVNLYERFGIEPLKGGDDIDPSSGFLILDLYETEVGIRMEGIPRIVSVDSTDIQPIPEGSTGAGSECARGTANHGELTILDVHRLFDPCEAGEMTTVNG